MICDECGKQVTSISRRYRGLRYCSRCYSREFKHAECPNCHKLARIYTRDKGALCYKCYFKQPCIRCKKDNYLTGKDTRYGPVCKVCSIYFRLPQTCYKCSKSVYQYTYYNQAEELYLCLKCAYKNGHRTCPECRRYRKVFYDNSGDFLCFKCLTLGKIKCPICNNLMPAGRGDKCEICYWKITLNKRIHINLSAFSDSNIKKNFIVYSHWLEHKLGPKKASLLINKHVLFFIYYEKFSDRKQIDEFIITPKSNIKIKSYKLVNLWISENQIKEFQKSTIDKIKELDLIKKILSELKEQSQGHKILMQYFAKLVMKENIGSTTLRSIRLALRPACDLLKTAQYCNLDLPDQKVLIKYLSTTPGQYSSINGFVNFLNSSYQIKLDIKSKEIRKSIEIQKRKSIEVRLINITKKLRVDPNNVILRERWITLAMLFFHDCKLSKKEVKKASSKVFPLQKGIEIVVKNTPYFLPKL